MKFKLIIATLALLIAGCTTNSPSQTTDLNSPLILAKQGSFFVGGRDIKSDNLSLSTKYASSGNITVDQMYVKYQIPINPVHNPLVLIHGCCLTAKTWETTPDGRMGWDEYFVRKGHPTYVIDQTWRGRSAGDISELNAVKSGKDPLEKLPDVFAAGHEAAWQIFRFGSEYPKTFEGQRFPLVGIPELWKQMVPDWLNAQPNPNPTVTDLSLLSKQLKKTILISHSQSGIYPFQTAQLDNTGIAGIVALEPGACPAANSNLSSFKNLPILVMFGDNVASSSRWAPRLKQCHEFVDSVNKIGGKAQLLSLPNIGIKGNTHMIMQDSNSLEIANIVLNWVEKMTE